MDEDRSHELEETKRNLLDAINQLAGLDAAERLEVFESLFGEDGELRNSDVPFVSDGRSLSCERLGGFRPFCRDEVEITDDELIVLRRPNVFLSHSHSDKPFVRSLADKLERAHIKAWIDEVELSFGDSLIERLRDAIDEVDLLLAVISKASVDSSWVQKEIEIAMTQEIRAKRVKVIPVVIENVELPGFLEGKMYGDFTTPYKRKKNMNKLVDSITSHLRSA